MDKIYKIAIPDGEVYMVKDSYSYYRVVDKYEGEKVFIIDNFMSKDEFIIDEIWEYDMHKLLSDTFNAAVMILPNGIKDIDISFYGNGIKYIELIIRWGDVEITNTYEQVHPLLGMYTRCNLEYYGGKIKMTRFNMFRDKYTKFERQQGYFHSHVSSSSNIRYFASVCLGNSNLRTTFMRRIATRNFDIYRLFMYIEAFIKWESLEGGPHFRLSNLYNNIGEKFNINSVAIEDIISIVENMNMEIILKEYGVSVPSNTISEAIIDNTKFKKTLPTVDKVKKDNWWLDYNATSDPVESDVTFNGQKVMIEIIPNTEDDDKLAETVFCYPNGAIVNYLSNKFSSILKDNELTLIVEEKEEILEDLLTF